MIKERFERILDDVCNILTKEAKIKIFNNSELFEKRVREELATQTNDIDDVKIDFDSPKQAFPDIAMNEFGVEVKFTKGDSWRSVGNSVLESQRVEGVKYIYIVYGKMGGIPEVRWDEYEKSIVHVRTSHVPRFEVDLSKDKKKELLFEQIGIDYESFRNLEMSEKMKYIREYAKKIHPDGKLWWIEESDGEEHSIPVEARLYTNLSNEEKKKLRAEAALVCPEIVQSGRVKNKYDNVALFLLTYHGVLCHQTRDLFSAGSVANPNNDDEGGIYIERALKILESDMKVAALELDDAVFVEYWGESVAPEDRIKRWLEKADEYAKEWKPSKSLFQ